MLIKQKIISMSTISKYYICLLVVSSIFLNVSCTSKGNGAMDRRLRIVNNSSDTIVPNLSCFYPDTSLLVNFNVKQTNLVIDTINNIITPQNNIILQVAGTWEYIFARDIPSDTLEIFIYNLNILRTVNNDTIVKKYLILKRYELSLDSLEKSNWIIYYP